MRGTIKKNYKIDSCVKVAMTQFVKNHKSAHMPKLRRIHLEILRSVTLRSRMTMSNEISLQVIIGITIATRCHFAITNSSPCRGGVGPPWAISRTCSSRQSAAPNAAGIDNAGSKWSREAQTKFVPRGLRQDSIINGSLFHYNRKYFVNPHLLATERRITFELQQ